MIFENDDLDWAFGELLHLIWRSKFEGARVEKLYPQQFFACMQVINRQPFEVRSQVIKIIRETRPDAFLVRRDYVLPD